MADSIEENFEQQGRPRWLALAPSTLKDREKKGYTGKILQRTGGLAASVAQDSGDDFARISIAKRYAAIQNFGGRAGRGGRTQIPARPFAKLSDTDIEEIQELVLNHFTT